MNTKVSYGNLSPSVIGGLGVVIGTLLRRGAKGETPVEVSSVSDVIEFSDSGIWGEDSLDPAVEPQVFRVSDFRGDFRLDYLSAPARRIDPTKLTKFSLRTGDLVVVKSSGSASQVVSGRVAVFEEQESRTYAASNFLLRLRPKRNIDPYYLAFVLGSPPVREAIADSVKTMTYPNLSFRIYGDLKVPVIPFSDQQLVARFFRSFLNGDPLPELPPYLAEQRRIVKIIDRIAQKIQEAKGLQQKVKDEGLGLLASVRNQIFSEQSGQTLFDQIVSDTLLGLVCPSSQQGPERAVPYLKMNNITMDGTLNLANVAKVDAFPQEVEKHALKDGDFLFNTRNSFELVGKTAVWRGNAGFIFNNNIMRIRFVEGVLPDYVNQAFLSSYVKSQLKASKKQTTNVCALYWKNLKAVKLPIPTIDEQRRIVAHLDNLQAKINKLKDLQNQTAAELDALLPSILDKAFKGEL